MIKFASLNALWLLLLPFAVYYILPIAKKMYGDALKVPFVGDIMQINTQIGRKAYINSGKVVSGIKLLWLAVLWGLVVVALCRPQWVGEPLKLKNNGRDILLVVDISNSMNERDFKYNNKVYDRLSAVKSVVGSFVDERSEDRLGLVVFGTRAYMQVPMTYDRQSLKEVLMSLDAGMAGNSTSIGDALGVALKNLALDDRPAENKVIILLTDGENNDGHLSFPQAIELAKQEKIKVYTIGVGNDRETFFGTLFNIPVSQELDEESLKQLAAATKGDYFRAKDVNSLAQVYEKINQLEKVETEGRFIQETKELFYYPAALALLMFLVMLGLVRRKTL